MRSLVKQVRKAVETGDTAEAKKALERALPMVDRVAGKGIIHRNTAARTKARLVRLVRKAG
jgi:small subunit ribosomal protein S20